MAEVDDTEFVQYLFSNASMSLYPENKPQHFTVHLPQPIILPGLWEVGLSAFQYPNNWYSIKNEIVFKVMTGGETIGLEFEWKDLSCPAGHYENIAEVCQKINEAIIKRQETEVLMSRFTNPPAQNLLENGSVVQLSYDKILQKIKLISKYNDMCIEFLGPMKKEIINILGMAENPQLHTDQIPKHDATLKLHFPSLMIYTTIVKYVGVADTKAPLLALIPVSGRNKEYIFERFDKPIYLPLAHNYITDIEILIKDDKGTDVPFLAGKISMILHFRRKA